MEQAQNSQPTFLFKKKTYKVLLHAVHIPGMGVLTATDIASDADAQKYLVESGCIGSVIDLVVE